MKASMRPQLGQSVNLTPQLLQAIRLLQLTAPQLELEVRQALEHNPMLEQEDPAEDPVADAAPDEATLETAAWDELPEPMFLGPRGAAGDDDLGARIAAPASSDPRVRLLTELEPHWPLADLELAAFWLDHTDDRGYLEDDAATLAAAGAGRHGTTAAELERVRQALLHGEWPGVAAAGVGECLAAQLATLPPSAEAALARRIVATQLDALAAHDVAALAQALPAPADAVAAALGLILSLRAHPMEPAAAAQTHVVPDVVAWHAGGQWRVALNDAALPRVRVSGHCEQALARAPGDTSALRGLLDEARWLVRGIAMRNDTLLRTTRVLVERQRGFLERGDEAMAPLTLREVADAIGMHESTISRVTSGKYLQTPRGTFELKRLFAVRLDGAQVGAVAVKAMVKRLIQTEPANAPLADDVIAGMLARQGVRIARRTVAKYRDQMAIGPASTRRQPHPAQRRFATA